MSDTRQSAVEFLNTTLRSATLESVVVFSDSTQMRLMSGEGQGGEPVWLSETSAMTLRTAKQTHTQRSSVVGYLHALLGRRIKQVVIDPDGVLKVHFGAALLEIAPDSVNLERIWSVTPTTPDPDMHQNWRIYLTDERNVVFDQV